MAKPYSRADRILKLAAEVNKKKSEAQTLTNAEYEVATTNPKCAAPVTVTEKSRKHTLDINSEYGSPRHAQGASLAHAERPATPRSKVRRWLYKESTPTPRPMACTSTVLASAMDGGNMSQATRRDLVFGQDTVSKFSFLILFTIYFVFFKIKNCLHLKSQIVVIAYEIL